MGREVITGDCIEALRGMPDASIDAVVTDPPYGLSQHTAADTAECLRAWVEGREYRHSRGGFMGRSWDAWVPGPEVWREVLRVLKPGGHALVFAGSRTVDLMGIALRLSGFEIRDSLHWLYGTGFPKSHNISKAIDKAAGAERKVVGVSRWAANDPNGAALGQMNDDGWVPPGRIATAPATLEAAQWEGWGTALKPAHEPIIVARKPLDGTMAANVLRHGCGGLNVDGCRVGTDTSRGDKYRGRGPGAGGHDGNVGFGQRPRPWVVKPGRWPPNIILTHALGCEGDRNGAGCVDRCAVGEVGAQSGDGVGTAARFFPSFRYCAKASRSEREAGLVPPAPGKRANRHPTVKPIEAMRWLVRLVTPPGGVVLDPFTGSGTTGCAAALEGFAFVGCEQDPEHADLARRRIAHWAGAPAPSAPPVAKATQPEPVAQLRLL